MTATSLRSLFTGTKLNNEFHLDVGKISGSEDSHKIYVAEYGNPKGIPVIVCHGGPGAGTPPYYAFYFDPKKYRIILFDQRGSGKSSPSGCVIDNTTQFLLEDMEKIRNHFGIEKWVVFGGSWGATLVLLYAEKHPDHTLGIILRGTFLAREHDITAFLREGCPAALLRPNEWKKLTTEIRESLKESNLKVDGDNILEGLYSLITQAPPHVQTKIASLMSWWELGCSYLKADMKEVEEWSLGPNGVNMGIIEITYSKKKCFIKPNQILDDAYKLKNIPIFIVHGEWDIICPPYQSAELIEKLESSQVTYFRTTAGHSAADPENLHYLIESTERLAKLLGSDR
jgi:proline iminopeptidase